MPDTRTAAPAWIRLGVVPPRELTATRLQLHHAVQVIVSAAISWLPPRPDDSHTSLTWDDSVRSLLTEPLNERGARFGVHPVNLSLAWLPGGTSVAARFTLHGHTVADALAWVRARGAEAAFDVTKFTAHKHYEIPAHTVASGGPFDARASAALAEFEHYWRNATPVLEAIVAREPGASPIRCWPHHFDLATLITLPAGPAPATRTIGVGLEPGDEWYAEPYWYVGPYPYPDTAALPPLDGGGTWHTDRWVGAVLPASSYVGLTDPEAQQQQVESFLHGAIRACHALLGA